MLRHGSPAYPEGEYPDPFLMGLSAAGRQEALAARAGVKAFNPSHVYTSDFRRAEDTARLAAGTLGVDIVLHAGLRERVFASLAGCGMDKLAVALGNDQLAKVMAGNSDTVDIAGEETYEQARQRTLAAVWAMYADHPDGRVLAVAHGGPHAWLLEVALTTDLKGKRVARLDPGRFTLFSLTADGISVEQLNCSGSCLATRRPTSTPASPAVWSERTADPGTTATT